MARWGLVPWFSKTMPKVPHINARAETVHEKPLFREAFAKRRALIPATGFFEWQKRADGKQPNRFQREDLEPFAFAGIWEFAKLGKEEILSAAIIADKSPNGLSCVCSSARRQCRLAIHSIADAIEPSYGYGDDRTSACARPVVLASTRARNVSGAKVIRVRSTRRPSHEYGIARTTTSFDLSRVIGRAPARGPG
jgi:hypothetical protein